MSKEFPANIHKVYAWVFPNVREFDQLPLSFYPGLVQSLSLYSHQAKLWIGRRQLGTGVALRFPIDQEHIAIYLSGLSPSRVEYVPSSTFDLLKKGESLGGKARGTELEMYPANLIVAGIIKDKHPVGVLLFLAGLPSPEKLQRIIPARIAGT